MEIKRKTVDAHGNILQQGDSVSLTKDLKVSGSLTLKRGTVIKNIRLSEEGEQLIEGKVNGTMMVIKTEFVKKM